MSSINSSKKVSFNNISPNPNKAISSVSNSLMNFFFGSDIAVVLTIIVGFILIALISVTLFEQVIPNVRTNFSSNIMAAIGAVGFIFVIFRYMGAKMDILGKSFDVGMILYVFSIFLLLILCSG